MKKVTSRWISHQLAHEQRVKLCHENLVKFQNDFWRLCDIITGDETIGRFIISQKIQAELAKVN